MLNLALQKTDDAYLKEINEKDGYGHAFLRPTTVPARPLRPLRHPVNSVLAGGMTADRRTGRGRTVSSLREDDWPSDRLCSGDENADGSRPRLKRCCYHMLDIPSNEEGLA